MAEKTKHDIMCIERGDVDYLLTIAEMLMSDDSQLQDQVENIAKALSGIANSAHELDPSGF